MRIFYRLVLLMGLLGMLLGCDGELPVEELPQQVVLESYSPNGELIARRTLLPDDPTYQRLKALLDVQRTGWKDSFASYKAGPFIIRTENIIIRCYPDMMVVDFMQSGRSQSVKKSMPKLLQTLGLSAP
jgi:hypothetical protein